MGLAASQARFLGLTARKSDKEFQGQQINQARTRLADQTDALFQQIMTLKVPTAGDPTLAVDEHGNFIRNNDGSYQFANKRDPVTNRPYYDPTIDPATGKPVPYLIEYTEDGLTFGYKQEMEKYSIEYDKANAKIEILHTQDRALETRLRAVDSEHNAVQTEIDAVKKVIEKNIEGTFKTFG